MLFEKRGTGGRVRGDCWCRTVVDEGAEFAYRRCCCFGPVGLLYCVDGDDDEDPVPWMMPLTRGFWIGDTEDEYC